MSISGTSEQFYRLNQKISKHSKELIMPSNNARQQLVEFLDRNAFDPVLSASEDDYSSEADKRALRDAQDSTRSEKERFHNYESAQKVKEMFQDDLSSEPAKKIQRELNRLNLPSLPDVEEEFMKKCEELDVS